MRNREIWFNVTPGVRQGSVLAPLLLIILKRMGDLGHLEQESDIFAYEDDVGLIACSKDELDINEIKPNGMWVGTEQTFLKL